MGKKLTLILGGARSGKSTFAEKFAAERGKTVLYVATAEAWDEEMIARIAKHQAERLPGWQTLEAPTGVGAAIQACKADVDVVLIDCLTMLANNVIIPLAEPLSSEVVEASLSNEIEGLIAAFGESDAEWIIVSNEVGSGIVPAFPLGRVYRDALGRANQRLASQADTVILMVAGLPLSLK